MRLHYFHANMTLEMVCCSVGIWGVMHLIASSERVWVYLRVFTSKLTYFCVCAWCLFFQFYLFISSSVWPRDVLRVMLWDPPAVGSDALQGVNAFSFELPPKKPESKALHPWKSEYSGNPPQGLDLYSLVSAGARRGGRFQRKELLSANSSSLWHY